MKTTVISVSYSCKFNDPQKRYMNHTFGTTAEAVLEDGEDEAAARLDLAKVAVDFVNGRRDAIYRAAQLEADFKEEAQKFKWAADNVKRYEEGTRQARQEMEKANGLYKRLEDLRAKLAVAGVDVLMPMPVVDVASKTKELPTRLDDEEWNDPDESVDEEADID